MKEQSPHDLNQADKTFQDLLKRVGLVVKRLRDPARFELKQRLIEEVQLAFRLHHPAIAQVHHLRGG